MTVPSEYEDQPVDPTIDPDIRPPERPTQTESTEDRVIVGELEVEPEPTPVPEAPKLDPEQRRDFERLLTVGRRVKTITVADHQVGIQTLKSADEMRIGLYTKDYLETQGFARAYQLAVCASGITEIKGQELFSSLKEITDKDELFAKKVEALAEFYPIVISKIYNEIMALEREFADLAIKLGKLEG